MIEDADREGVEMDVHLIAALSERATAMEEQWRFHATVLILTDMLGSDAATTEDEHEFAKVRETLGTILTLMLYIDKLPTEDEIEADVMKFRKMLDLANGDANDEEDPRK